MLLAVAGGETESTRAAATWNLGAWLRESQCVWQLLGESEARVLVETHALAGPS